MEESSRLKYINDKNVVYDSAFNANKDVYGYFFSLGQTLDNYQFRRFSPTESEAEHILEKRLKQLREKYNYIRLWFGGGKDCRIILDAAIKYCVKIDEIVIARRCCENTLGLYPEYNPLLEIDSIGVEYIQKIKNQIPSTKITIVNIDDQELELVYKSWDWWKHSTEWFFGNAYLPRLFFKYINPELNYIKYQTNSCDLLGSATPALWYNNNINQWEFCFSDRGFSTVSSATDDFTVQEDFLITNDMPELLELHVNSVIDSLNEKITKSHWGTNPRQLERTIKEQSLFYKNLKTLNGYQFDKTIFDIKFPTNDYFWSAGQSERSFYEIINRYMQTPMPKCLDFYINQTDWATIKSHVDQGYILTKVWKLKG